MSNARKQAIRARFTSGYTLEDFRTLFMKAVAMAIYKDNSDSKMLARIPDPR